MAGTYLMRTMNQSENTNSDKKFTYSGWIKKSETASDGMLIEGYYSSTFHSQLYYQSNGALTLNCASGTSGAAFQIVTNRLLRDCNAWYHIVVAIDTTQGTASDRAKIYINGVQETSFSGATYPNQNTSHQFNRNGNTAYLGRRTGGGVGLYFNGLMSHIHTTIGYTYDASAFGSTDSTTGEWKINTSPSVTYGTNGFFILKDNGAKTDQSGNSNNFSEEGTPGIVSNTQDNPSNVFCTLNPLARGDLTNNAILSNGNTYYSSDQTGYNIRVGTIGANKGKWYWEGKFISHNPQTSPGMPLGIIADNIPIATNVAGGQAPYYYAYNYDGSNGTVTYNSSDTNYGTTILNTVGQIGMVALDLDNNKVYFGVNGTWTNSGNPANGTNGYSIIDPADTPLGFYLPAVSDRSSIREYVYAWNFGNGYFGTTAVSSAGTNASGNGIFEYDCPAGFTALSTKGLNL